MEWISVKDRLPELCTFSYIYCLDGTRCIAYFTDGTDASLNKIQYWQATDSSSDLISEVTHWMPLPEPPKS